MGFQGASLDTRLDSVARSSEQRIAGLHLDKPVIATLVGYCLGGGLELPLAVAGVLRAVVGAEHLPLEDALRVERDAVRRCSASADQLEGMTAFLEKRPPVFRGR